MNSSKFSLVLALLLSGCSKPSAPTTSTSAKLPPRLDTYFESYCDYMGGSSDSYDYLFRQYLKRTKDPELKRLFVLQELDREIRFALGDIESGVTKRTKGASPPLTLVEWQSAKQRIQIQVEDFAAYSTFTNSETVPVRTLDPLIGRGFEEMTIAQLRWRLKNLTNPPANRFPPL